MHSFYQSTSLGELGYYGYSFPKPMYTNTSFYPLCYSTIQCLHDNIKWMVLIMRYYYNAAVQFVYHLGVARGAPITNSIN